MKKLLPVAIAAIILSGCATKQYPQSPQVTGEEITAMDCKAVDVEIAKQHAVQDEIKQTGQFDGLTILGFLGDFGIGNGIAKSNATGKANARLNTLEGLRDSKCHGTGA